MPDETVYITDVERDILQIFMQRGVLDNPTILATLRDLIEKLQK